ncbi:MAG: response regulator [Myxococcota bacterium]
MNERDEETILVVDDEPAVVRILTRIMKREGFQVVSASDGVEALEVLKSQRVVGMITDVMMPRMDGLTLLREVRAAGYEFPAVVISGFIEPGWRPTLVACDVARALQKPFTPAQVRDAVRGVFDPEGR